MVPQLEGGAAAARQREGGGPRGAPATPSRGRPPATRRRAPERARAQRAPRPARRRATRRLPWARARCGPAGACGTVRPALRCGRRAAARRLLLQGRARAAVPRLALLQPALPLQAALPQPGAPGPRGQLPFFLPQAPSPAGGARPGAGRPGRLRRAAISRPGSTSVPRTAW